MSTVCLQSDHCPPWTRIYTLSWNNAFDFLGRLNPPSQVVTAWIDSIKDEYYASSPVIRKLIQSVIEGEMTTDCEYKDGHSCSRNSLLWILNHPSFLQS